MDPKRPGHQLALRFSIPFSHESAPSTQKQRTKTSLSQIQWPFPVPEIAGAVQVAFTSPREAKAEESRVLSTFSYLNLLQAPQHIACNPERCEYRVRTEKHCQRRKFIPDLEFGRVDSSSICRALDAYTNERRCFRDFSFKGRSSRCQSETRCRAFYEDSPSP